MAWAYLVAAWLSARMACSLVAGPILSSRPRIGTCLGDSVRRSSSVGDYDGDNPWVELGITPDASASEIRRAYRQAALRTHPDVNKTPEAAEKFRRIAAAYELVRDAEKLAKWKRVYQRSRPTVGRKSSTSGWKPPSPPEYDDADGDSFGAIFSDMLRGIASSPRTSARAVVEDLLDILEQIPIDSGGARSFDTETERRRAEDEQRKLAERLDFMLSNEIEPQLASAKANEAACRARGDVDELLLAVERTAGLKAKKDACERQLKIARKEIRAIAAASVGNVKSSTQPPQSRANPGQSSYSAPNPSASSPYRSGPAARGIDDRATLRERRVDDELNELKRSLGKSKSSANSDGGAASSSTK